MKFSEKLSHLTRNLNKQEVGRDAGLARTTISDYIAKGSTPKVDKALALARVLKVPLDWLVDDSRDLPPPDPIEATPSQFTDDVLLREVIHRRRLAQLDLLVLIERAETINWSEIRSTLESLSPNESPPSNVLRGLATINAIDAAYARLFAGFDLHFVERLHWPSLPGKELPAETLSLRSLMDRTVNLSKNVDYNALGEPSKHDPRLFFDPDRVAARNWLAKLNDAAFNSTDARRAGKSKRKKQLPATTGEKLPKSFP